MNLHDFIFSNDWRHRLSRHLSFWMGWFLFSSIAQISFTGNDPNSLKSLSNIIVFQVVRSSSRLLSISLFCYFVVYFLVPQFVKQGRFRRFVIFLFLAALSLYVISYGSFYLCVNVLQLNPFTRDWDPYKFFFNSFYSNINFTGAVPTCCLMLIIKYYKNWYVKQRISEQLSRENIQAELQMLKAQVHPHFLFNTLNNIYSFVLTGDHRADGLVDKLSGMIDYMRTEGQHSLVSLEKEIQLIKDYVGLEKVRYGDRLELIVEIKGEYQNKLIAPLLMIPFVENCFKHGASVMRGKQWIHLVINVSETLLDFRLGNSKPPGPLPEKNKKSIGLVNVNKRLQLLYPAKHSLDIKAAGDVYEVRLVLTLQNVVSEKIEQAPSTKNQAYA